MIGKSGGIQLDCLYENLLHFATNPVQKDAVALDLVERGHKTI